MKILHITAVRYGSTGKTATDLKTLLTSKGDQFKIAFSEFDNKPIDGDIKIGSLIDHKVHALFSRLFGLQGYFSLFSTLRFLKKVKSYKPDLVQLGNLHANYINLPLLFRFLVKEKIPVVMILHDCWFFTGKCTHFTARNCEKWKTECCHCPALKSDNESWFFDCSRKVFSDRKRWYNALSSLSVIAVSDWEKDQAKQSPLFSNATITRVYNWIDLDLFKPASIEDKNAVMAKYNLSTDCKYVITVGAGWTATSSKSKDAISLSFLLPDKLRLIIVGKGEESVFPDSIVRISYISDPSELAALYSIASAYLHFSVEDTFGKVIAEAMACETVPIVFGSTACGETAGPFGIIVSPHDVKSMADSIFIAEDLSRRRQVREYAVLNYYKPKNFPVYWGEKSKDLLNNE